MAFSSPYLLQLGLPKYAMAMVFVAGPISGLLVAPYIGESDWMSAARIQDKQEGEGMSGKIDSFLRLLRLDLAIKPLRNGQS